MAEVFRYAAFISYASKDAKFARRLHRALEAYRIPAQLGEFDLIGGGRKNRVFPVFRDREELPSGELGEAISAALGASGALIVVCSPHAAASPWVNKEIDTFIALGRRDRIFAILTPDAPLTDAQGNDATAQSFPPAFRGDGLAGGFEPLAADTRKQRDGFRNAWLKLVAGLLGVNAGALQDRDRKRRRRQNLMVASGAMLLTSTAVYSAAWWNARDWRSSAAAEAARLMSDRAAMMAAPIAVAALPPPAAVVGVANAESIEVAKAANGSRILAYLGAGRATISEQGVSIVSRSKFTVTALHLPTMRQTVLSDAVSYALSSDGESLAVENSPDLPSGLRIIRLADGKIRHLPLEVDVSIFALSHDGDRAAVYLRGSMQVREVDLTRGAVRDVTLPRTSGAKVARLEYAAGDAVVLAIPEDGANIAPLAIDVTSGGVRDAFAGHRDVGHFAFATDAPLAFVQRNDPGRTALVVHLTTGRTLSLGSVGDLYGEPWLGLGARLSPDGRHALLRRSENGDGGYFALDTQTGARTEIGAGFVSASSRDGTLFAIQPANETSVDVYDLLSGPRRRFPDVGMLVSGRRHMMVTPDGKTIYAQRNDDAGALVAIDAKTGEVRETGAAGNFNQFQGLIMAPRGDRLLLRGADDWHGAYVLDPTAQRLTFVGALNGVFESARDVVFSKDSQMLALHWEGEPGGVTVVDVSVDLHGKETDPAQIAATACAANANFMLPFPSEMREGDSTFARALRGRPWNPCDWRGLAAVLPDRSRGDGWFEGPRQWWRRVQVTLLGRDDVDYPCATTTSQASRAVREARARMCALFEAGDRPL